MPSELISRLTERFFRVDVANSRAHGGTGLGLAIVKHILRRHGTELGVESQLGKGSVFFFDLPAVSTQPLEPVDRTPTVVARRIASFSRRSPTERPVRRAETSAGRIQYAPFHRRPAVGASILDGNAIARELRHGIAAKVRSRLTRGLPRPGLAVLLVGDDRGSEIYVRLKRKDCHEVGFNVEVRHLPADTCERDLLAIVDELNADPRFNGILVQLPLPGHIDPVHVTERVLPDKDVDGVHPRNMGRLVLREPAIRPCTSRAVMALLDRTGVVLRGMHATVVGASNHVGRPMGLELLLVGCTVTTVHRFSRGTRNHVAQADIVVSATGKAGLIEHDWVKPGAIVIDVGIVAQADGKVRGDVRFDEVAQHAGWITPVPGGVGPMTRALLLDNTLLAAELADQARAAGA